MSDTTPSRNAPAGRDHGPAARGRRHRPGSRTARVATVGAALTAAGAALAVTAAASATAAPSAAGSWRIVKRVHSGAFGDFTAVVGVGRTGGWAFNGISSPTAWRRSGASWTRVAFPGQAGEEVVAAGASSASNVWAFTSGGPRSRALRWNGSRWSVSTSFPEPPGGAVVLSPSDVWAFGQPFIPGSGLGAWRYNGRVWARVAGGAGLEGGSGLSASDVWAFEGTSVAHWNGHRWARTSVARLLPKKVQLNDPTVVGIDAQAPNSVYAIGNGNAQDEGGPTVVLHFNGHIWRRVAQGNFGLGDTPLQQVSSDGRGGLWIPMPGTGGRPSFLVHYSGGRLTEAPLPGGAARINVESVALIPGTTSELGGGFTHAPLNPGAGVVAVILQLGR
jgi:hypothetical protein